MPNGKYGGVRGRKTKVGGNYFCFPPTQFLLVFADMEKSFLIIWPQRKVKTQI